MEYQNENIELSEVEKAKQIIADAEKKNMEAALAEFNSFIDEWGKKYNVRLTTAGEFFGQQLNTRIEIIKK